MTIKNTRSEAGHLSIGIPIIIAVVLIGCAALFVAKKNGGFSSKSDFEQSQIEKELEQISVDASTNESHLDSMSKEVISDEDISL